MSNRSISMLLLFLLFPFSSTSAFTATTHHLFGSGQVALLNSERNHLGKYTSSSSSSPISTKKIALHMTKEPLTKNNEDISKSKVGKEVQELLARAKAIRDSIPDEVKEKKTEGAEQSRSDSTESSDPETPISDSDASPSVGYRLYIDIGREDGTWMDPKWGASGRRIETTIDVDFFIPNKKDSQQDLSLASEEIIGKMVKDNLSGKSSAVRILNSSSARLRGGFDKMKCGGGGYRIDAGSANGGRSASSTARFFIEVDGTEEVNSGFGDISIPKGCLYFSLPCFNNNMKQLSSKEGIVTVRQMGWHTGWRREESRIVGVFRSVPIEQARKRDRY